MMLNRPSRRISRIVADPLVGILGLVAVAAVVMVFVEPSFVSIANITNVIGAMIAIGFLAIGMTVVLICRGLDLSVGAVMALSAGVAAALLNNGLPMPVAFAAALGVGTAVGCLNGLLATKLAVPDFIATLAVGSIATGILLYWTRGVPILGYMSPAYEYVGGLRRLIGPVTLPMLLLAGLAVITALVLRRTTLGIRLYAVGSSPRVPSTRGCASTASRSTPTCSAAASPQSPGSTSQVAPPRCHRRWAWATRSVRSPRR